MAFRRDRRNSSFTRGQRPVADPALIENSPQGPLPRIADDGRKPMTAYAAPAATGKFRIAIRGVRPWHQRQGDDRRAGQPAAGVTLGFAPYAGDVQHWVNRGAPVRP
jgi:hypothetical protein